MRGSSIGRTPGVASVLFVTDAAADELGVTDRGGAYAET